MRRPRFTIRSLMWSVAIVGMGLASWRSANRVWANLVFNLTVVVLLVATYKAKFSHGPAGAWWLGFASLGWVHLVLWLAGTAWGQSSSFWAQGHSFNLSFITEVMFWMLAALLGPDQIMVNLGSHPDQAIARMVILQSLTSLLAGLAGAWIFRLIAAHRHRELAGRSEGEGFPKTERGSR